MFFFSTFSALGTGVSMFVKIMKGDYDALLIWPFPLTLDLSLVDQSPNPLASIDHVYKLKPNLCKVSMSFYLLLVYIFSIDIYFKLFQGTQSNSLIASIFYQGKPTVSQKTNYSCKSQLWSDEFFQP